LPTKPLPSILATMPPTGTIYPLADRIFDGKLAEQLATWRTQGLSFDSIARELHGRGVTTTGETVRRWCSELEVAS